MAHVPNMARGKISLARGIHYCPSLFLLPDERFYIVKNVCRPTCIHIPDCVQTVYKLPLLPNSTAIETFLHKSGAVRSVDWIFLAGAPA